MNYLIVLFISLFLFINCNYSQRCSSNTTNVKSDARYLTSSYKSELIDTLKAMKTVSSSYNSSLNAYDYFVKMHIDAFDNPIHGYWLFAPWHRELIRRFDSELQRVSGNPSLVFPYWDSLSQKSTDGMFSEDFLGPAVGDGSNGWIISGPLSSDFPVDPILSESNIVAESKFKTLARCAGNGQFACLSTTNKGTFQVPYILDPTYAIKEVAESDNPRLGPFFSVLGDIDFFTVDKFATKCNWEDNQCLWYFKNDTGSRFICTHLSPVRPTKIEEECLKRVFNYDSPPDFGVGVTNDYLRPCLEGIDPSNAYVYPWATLGVTFLPPHGAAHTYIGGSLTQAGSPNDPGFFGIHSDVDRIWAEWQLKYSESFTQSQLSTELPLFPGVTVSDVLSIHDLGFTYDTIFCPEELSNDDDDDDSSSSSSSISISISISIISIVSLILFLI